MTSKDLQLINEKYQQMYAHQALTESTRRDFFKQLAGTIASAALDMGSELMKLSNHGGQKGWIINVDFIDINQWQKIVEPIVGSGNAARYASQIKSAIENKKPLKIDDRLAKQIVSFVQTDTSMGNMGMWNNYTINSEIDKVINDLQKRVSNQEAAAQFKQKVLDAFVNQKAPNGAIMLPAGDIISYSTGKTYYAADDMIKKGMFVGDAAIENIVKNVTTKYSHQLNDVDFKADAQKANARDNIEYSPADYLGGAPAGGSEQHGYKLAVDNVNIYASYLQVISEGTQIAKQLVTNGKLSNEDFDKLKAADPTKDKFKYVDWMATQWIKQPQPNLQTLANAMKEFDDLSKTNRFQGAANDIQSYKSLEELTAAINELKQSSEPASAKQLKNDYDVEVNNDDILVVAPKTHAASRKLGLSEFKHRKCPVTGLPKDSAWCITYSTDDHWNEYVYNEHLSFYFVRIKSDRLKKLLFKHEKFNNDEYLILAVVVSPHESNDYSKGLSGVTATDKTMPRQDFSEYLKIIEPFLNGKSVKDLFVDKKLYLEHNKAQAKKAKQNLKDWLDGKYEGEILNLKYAAFATLPNNIHSIDRGLDLSDSNISSLQNVVEVNGKLYLENSKIATLNQDKLIVHGTLNLDHCKNITTLPQTLHCKSLSISRSGITSLPANLHIDIVLFMIDTLIKTIPQGLKIKYGYFAGSQVETIPRDFECEIMDVRNTPFAKKYSLQQMTEMLPKVQKIKI